MLTLERASAPWLLVVLSLAAVARCGDPKFEHRHTVATESLAFALEVDAHGGHVIVGDQFASTVRILRPDRKRLVEEARFLVPGGYLGEEVAIHGNRAAARDGDEIHIYERDNLRRWRLVVKIPSTGCSELYRPHSIALDDDVLVIGTYDTVCIAEPSRSWKVTPLAKTTFNTANPVIDGNTIAVSEYKRDAITLYMRDATGWRQSATLAVKGAHALALRNGVLAVESKNKLHLFDVTTTRAIAALRPQSKRSGEHFGAELELDKDTLAAWADDGVHLYRRSGKRWGPAGIVPSRLPDSKWFGSTLVLDGRWLWIADPDMAEEKRGGGFVHGFERGNSRR